MNHLNCPIATMLALIFVISVVPMNVAEGQSKPLDALKAKGAERFVEQTLEAPRGARRMDACRSSAEKPDRRLSSGFLQSLGNPESFLVLTGCGENQSSVEDSNLGHGEQLARALVKRGVAFWKMGQPDKEVADYTRVIEMKDAPAEQVAEALVNRGITFGQVGQEEKKAADFARVIEMRDAPAEQVAKALVHRGWANYQRGKLGPALEDSREALEIDARNHEAAYNIGLILLRQSKLAEARKAYEAAVAGGLDVVRGAIDDLVELRDKLKGPPETTVFLGLLRMHGGDDSRGREDLAAYVKAHPDGPLAGWAKELLAVPATQPGEKQSP